MRYSDDLIEEVRSRNDIVDVIGSYVSLRRAGSSYTGLCPFHNEKTPSFNVSRSKQMYYCFGCHAGGNVYTFMMEYNNMTFTEAVQYLADRAGVTLPKMEYSPEAKAQADKKAALLEIHKAAATYYYYALRQKQGETGLNYLKNRGLTDDTIRKFGLGYADRSGGLYRYLKSKEYSDELLGESGLFIFDENKGVLEKFWNRVIFPIQDVRGKVIGFGGRVMGEGKPKYLNSPDTFLFNKRNHLFGLNIARATRRKYMILCEGYMDVITMHQAGFDNTVASLGTALTGQQAGLLKRYTESVLLLYDSDGAGKTAVLRAIPILKDAGIGARVVDLRPCKDPDEFIRQFGSDEMEKRLSEASDAFMYEIEDLESEFNLDDPQEKTVFQRETAKRLLNFPEELERENYIEALSRKYRINPDSLRKLTNRMALSGETGTRRVPPGENDGSRRGREEKKDDGIVHTEKLMLSYLANYPSAYPQTKEFVGPGDFSDPLCRSIAEGLYEQLEEREVNEAALINHFAALDDQRAVASLFHTTIDADSPHDQDVAFTDTVVRIMKASNERQIREWDGKDMNVLRSLAAGKKKLEEFRGGGRIFHLEQTQAGE